MNELESCLEQLDALNARVRSYRKRLAESGSPSERETLRGKITTYRAIIRDIQVQVDYLRPPKPKARSVTQKRLCTDALSFDFFERNNLCFSDLEGSSWAQLQAGELVDVSKEAAVVRQWLGQAAARLTKRQTLYLDAYYNRGLSMERIGADYHVHRGTVSRVIQSGMRRLEEWVEAKRLIGRCRSGPGQFDWMRYLTQNPVLTDRQRELALLVLSRCPKDQEELARKLELEPSTVSRTLTRAGKTLRRLEVGGGAPVSRPALRDWNRADKFSLALQTHMPLYFYYRYCFRGQTIGGLSRYQYELARRQAAGESPEEVAREFGMKLSTVRGAFQRLRRVCGQMGGLHPPTDNSLAGRLDPETYLKLQRMVIRCADS